MTEDPRISEIRDELEWLTDNPVATPDDLYGLLERIRVALNNPAPAPRVFLPGDTVPKGVATVMPPRPDEDRAHPYVMHEAPWGYVLSAGQAAVELPLPSVEDVRTAIEQAHRQRLAEATARPHLGEGTNP